MNTDSILVVTVLGVANQSGFDSCSVQASFSKWRSEVPIADYM
ncbi:hypothetical protein A20C1_03283 [marine actinobacterium PHSC20C1]|nr:hypothetical protein A20C1_03283 [marine actinobacterium PHSC20C1]